MSSLHIIKIFVAVAWAAVTFVMVSCQSQRTQTFNKIDNRAEYPILSTEEVNTIISDSGIIRYRIKTPVWDMFDKAPRPYWSFPQGIYLERFDSVMHVDSSVKSDTAYYYERDQIWELRGNVKVINLQGEKFETPLLFWDQKTEKIYSDKFIRIEQAERIITGIGFESNQSMTVYTILNPQGIFPVEDAEESPSDSIR